MTLTICLTQDEGKPITPGSVVLGVVKLRTYDDQIIESLEIDFKGLTKVFLKQNYGDLAASRADYLSKGYLFSRHQNLHSGGGCIQRKGTYAWPFAFRVPLFAAPRILPSGSKDLFNSTVPWRGDLVVDKRPHPLPPSMVHTGKFLCSVHYFLEATLVQRPAETRDAKSKSTTVQTSRNIPIQTLDMTPRAEGDWPYIIHRRKMRCTSTGAHLHTALRRIPFLPTKALGVFPRSETELYFSVLLPRRIDCGKQPPLSIPVSCSIHKPSAAQSPGSVSAVMDRSLESIELCFKLSLIQHTQARAGCHASSSSRRIFMRQGSVMIPVSGPVSSSTSAETETEARTNTPSFSVNLSDMTDLSVPTVLLAADFSTYNIAQSHSFDVLFRIRYAGRKHKVVLRSVPVRVAPRSEDNLERQLLNEGVEEDDVWGCDLAGIPWRDYATRSGGTREDLETLMMEDYESDEDDGPKTPPPTYTA